MLHQYTKLITKTHRQKSSSKPKNVIDEPNYMICKKIQISNITIISESSKEWALKLSIIGTFKLHCLHMLKKINT